MPFTIPPINNGQPNVDNVSRYPEISEPAAQAKVFGTAVMLAAAGRSSGATTAITYEARVGTSICDRALRTNSNMIATVRLGENGTRISRTFDGRWVNTMVLIKPMRSAIGTAIR